MLCGNMETNEHSRNLSKLCRICATRNGARKAKTFLCNDPKYSSTLLQLFGIDSSSEDNAIFPTHFCLKCYKKIKNFSNGRSIKPPADLCQPSSIWTIHDEQNCYACSEFEKKVLGGRPHKIPLVNNLRNRGVPSVISNPSSVTSSDSHAIVKNNDQDPSYDTDISRISCAQTGFENPCSSPCSNNDSGQVDLRASYLSPCDSISVNKNSSILNEKTPSTDSPFVPNQTSTPFSNVDFKTPRRSRKRRIKRIKEVLESPTDAVWQRLVDSDERDAIPEKVIKIGSEVARRLEMFGPGPKGYASFKTRGQPRVFLRVTNPRKSSHNASDKTVKSRNKTVGKCIQGLSGAKLVKGGQFGKCRKSNTYLTKTDTCGELQKAIDKQLTQLVKSLDKSTRNRVCGQAGVKMSKICAKLMLSLHLDAGLTWYQGRILRRYLKQCNVQCSSEKEERLHQKTALKDVELVTKKVEVIVKDANSPDSMDSLVLQNRTVSKVKDIVSFAHDKLDEYDRSNLLIWEGIPNGEIWIKIGGDMGGSLFKLTLQVLNVKHPNAQRNTNVILCLDAPDSRDNLEIILRPLSKQIKSLKSEKWRNKVVVLFLCGDIDFLCKVLGLSGAAGVHPCFCCNITITEIQVPPAERSRNVTLRSNEGMMAQYKKFEDKGKGNKKLAQNFENCIAPVLIPIELDHVVDPYLHEFLGLALSNFKFLEYQTNLLDQVIIRKLANDDSYITDDTLLGNHVAQIRKRIRVKKQKNELLCALGSAKTDKQKESISSKIEKCDKEHEKLKKIKLNPKSGPVTAQLDTELKANDVWRSAYYSNSFVGNQANKLHEPKVIAAVCNSVVTTTKKYTQEQSTVKAAEKIRDDFFLLFSRYRKLHKLISHAKPMNDTQIQQAKIAIVKYTKLHRKMYSGYGNITPKLHLLEDHNMKFIEQYKHGLGFHGEQAVESVHAVFNTYLRMTSAIRERSKRIASIMRLHHTKNSQLVHQNTVAVKHRNFKDPRELKR